MIRNLIFLSVFIFLNFSYFAFGAQIIRVSGPLLVLQMSPSEMKNTWVEGQPIYLVNKSEETIKAKIKIVKGHRIQVEVLDESVFRRGEKVFLKTAWWGKGAGENYKTQSWHFIGYLSFLVGSFQLPVLTQSAESIGFKGFTVPGFRVLKNGGSFFWGLDTHSTFLTLENGNSTVSQWGLVGEWPFSDFTVHGSYYFSSGLTGGGVSGLNGSGFSLGSSYILNDQFLILFDVTFLSYSGVKQFQYSRMSLGYRF